MTDRELMQQALEALEDACGGRCNAEYNPCWQRNVADALRERLAQPEQEPLQFKCTVIDDAHPNGVPLEQWGKQPEQEPVTLPCCGYADASAVKWNPYSKAVQCHNCGQTYTPLAQPEQEPVAYATKEDFHRELERRLKHIREEMKIKSVTMRCKDFDIALPIIDTDFGRVLVGQVSIPPQRKPLTDEEISEIAINNSPMVHEFARAIEAAHGIKEKT